MNVKIDSSGAAVYYAECMTSQIKVDKQYLDFVSISYGRHFLAFVFFHLPPHNMNSANHDVFRYHANAST